MPPSPGRWAPRKPVPLVDSHCHLDQPIFDGDRQDVLDRARVAGVDIVVVPAIRPRGWQRQAWVRDQHPELRVLLGIGVHPQIVPDLFSDERAIAEDPDAIAEAATRWGAVAIGECGLDGGTADLPGQERCFRAQLRAARQLKLPAIIHVFRAHHLAPRILAEEQIGDFGGVLHSYSGGADLVPVYARLGLAFSFAGPVSYPGNRRPVEAARVVPEGRLLAETDAPDQAPEPHRGGRCEPAFLPSVIAALAAARGISAVEMAAITTHNARRLFRLG